MRKNLGKVWPLCAASLLCLATSAAYGDSLHGCYGTPTPTICTTSNGTIIPVTTGSPTFTFTDASGPATSDFWVVALIPNNLDPNASLAFSVNYQNGGSNNTTNGSTTANPVLSNGNPAVWNSGFLDSFLGISASPANGISNYLGCTQTGNCGTGSPFQADPAATGFYVYVADLGQTKLAAQGSPTGNPILTLTTPLPEDSFIVGFLDPPSTWTATANSEALFIDAQTPEPSEIGFLLAGMFVIGFLGLRRRRQA